MLKLTKKADYGLMALKYLAEHPDLSALSAKEVADAYGNSAQLLAKNPATAHQAWLAAFPCGYEWGI